MFTLGLTGSIGMGKSQTLQMMRRLWRGAAFYDADAEVRKLHQQPVILAAIARRFPPAVKNGALCRETLAKLVFDDPAAKHDLQAIIFPHLHKAERLARQQAMRRRAKVMVFDVPLLFETKANARFHKTLLAHAPAFLQQQRVLARKNMTHARFLAIKASQLPQAEKRKMADFIVLTGLGRAFTTRRLQRLRALW